MSGDTLRRFDEFVRLTNATRLRPGIIYPTTTAEMRASTDRITFDWICAYCETRQKAARERCENCGAAPRSSHLSS